MAFLWLLPFRPSHNHQCSGRESPESLLSEGRHLEAAILVKGLESAKKGSNCEGGQPKKMGTGSKLITPFCCACLCLHVLSCAHPTAGGYLDRSVIIMTKSHTSGQVRGLAQGWHSMPSCQIVNQE